MYCMTAYTASCISRARLPAMACALRMAIWLCCTYPSRAIQIALPSPHGHPRQHVARTLPPPTAPVERQPRTPSIPSHLPPRPIQSPLVRTHVSSGLLPAAAKLHSLLFTNPPKRRTNASNSGELQLGTKTLCITSRSFGLSDWSILDQACLQARR